MSNNQMKTLLESMDAISEYASTPTPFAMRVNALMRAVKQLAGARDDQQRAAAFKGVERKF